MVSWIVKVEWDEFFVFYNCRNQWNIYSENKLLSTINIIEIMLKETILEWLQWIIYGYKMMGDSISI